jgi:hypothetical protein
MTHTLTNEQIAASLWDTNWERLKTYSSENPQVLTTEEHIEEILAIVQIDSIPDPDFGEMYRLWNGSTLMGTFYRKIFTSDWVAIPKSDSCSRYFCSSPEDAQYWIIYDFVIR